MVSKINISMVLSVVAFAVSLVCAILCSKPVKSVEVVISTSSVLVTVLIGWNIYAVVDSDKETNSMETKIRSVIRRMNREMKHTVRAYTSFLSAGDGYSMGNIEIVIDNHISAIEESIKGNEREPIDLSLYELSGTSVFYSSRDIVPKTKKEEKARYISTLYRLNHDEHHSYDIDKITTMIDSAGQGKCDFFLISPKQKQKPNEKPPDTGQIIPSYK